MFNKRLRIVVAVVLALSLMLLASPSAYALTEGDVGGTFQVGNSVPTVDTVELYSDAVLETTVINMTPLTTYYAKVTVSDANTIDNIDEVKLELFYDILGTDLLDAPGVADTQTDAIFTWTKGGTFVMSAMTDTTWTIVTAECVEPAPMTASSGDWVFAFTVGKVATVSSALTGDWDMYGKATDVAPASGERYTDDKDIVFYSEVTAVTASADFGMVIAGSGFLDDDNEVSGIAITYIANGDYSASVKAVDWAGAGGATAIYDDDGLTAVAQEFSLKADIDASLLDAVQVLSVSAGAVVNNAGTITAEAGDVTTTNALWLKLATSFTDDVYSGTITYIIANR